MSDVYRLERGYCSKYCYLESLLIDLFLELDGVVIVLEFVNVFSRKYLEDSDDSVDK